MTRIIVLCICAVCFALLTLTAWLADPTYHGGFFPNLLGNFASEVFGLIFTFLFVDGLLRRHRREDEARKLALTTLHDIDQAVWVWLGGQREFGLTESRQLLRQVNDSAVPAHFTQTLLMNLGSRTANVVRTRESLMQCRPLLARAFAELIPLAGLRDQLPPHTMAPGSIASHLLAAQPILCQAAGIPIPPENPSSNGAQIDPSIHAQRWRHCGEI